jgi:hypothetical protein
MGELDGLPAWEQGLITVLKANTPLDRRQFRDPTWISVLGAGYYVKGSADPWNDPMGTPYANEFTIYRREYVPGSNDDVAEAMNNLAGRQRGILGY